MLSELERIVKLEVNGQIFDAQDIDDTQFDLIQIEDNRLHLLFENQSLEAKVLSVNLNQKRVTLVIDGIEFQVNIINKLDDLIHKLGFDQVELANAKEIKAPMPGLVLDILVKKGQEVKSGDNLIILEAMKMENVLQAPNDGKIKSIEVKKDNSVEKNQILINFE